MKFKKRSIAMITGGASVEHTISIQSAQKIMQSIIEHHDIVLIYISPQGDWRYINDTALFMGHPVTIEAIQPLLSEESVALMPHPQGGCIINTQGHTLAKFDVALPMCHGTYGEDGCLQGMLNLINVPFIGTDVQGASIAMNKSLSKTLAKHHGVHVANHLLATPNDRPNKSLIQQAIGYPLFVKPNHLGSSLGISHVHHESEVDAAIDKALSLDHEVLIEQAIVGREIECGLLDVNGQIHAGLPGEICSPNHFYSFSEKYLSSSKSQVCCPAQLDEYLTVQRLAIDVFKALKLESFARIDFFLSKDHQWYFNEANPIPGFTNISMFPLSIEASGISYIAMFDAMLDYAFSRHARKQKNYQLIHNQLIYS